MKPSAEEIAFFHENGFLVVDRLTTDEEADWLATVYEKIHAEDNPLERSGVLVDPELKGKLTQYFNPELRFPDLLNTTYFRNAKTYAAALLGEDESNLTVWSHMIRKAPGARNVPPHQDEAFWPPDYDYRAVNLWLALHDVTVEMGAMQFIPGSHKRGVLEHRHYDHPAQNLLEVADESSLPAPVSCPLPKGGCTFHHPATVHLTNPNATDTPRLAYQLTVQTEPIRRSSRRVAPWYEEFVDAIGGVRQSSYVADGQVLPLPS